MADYNLVKKCRICLARFVVNKSQSRQNYCEKCQARKDKEAKSEE